MATKIETETIDKLFLELSQFTKATTGRELRLREPLEFAVKTRRELDTGRLAKLANVSR